MKNEFEEAARPVARLLGHSLAAALGFVGIALISLIPISVLKLVLALGVDELASPLRILEVMLLVADMLLFTVVFLTGVVVFAAETLASAKSQISKAWKDGGHD